MAPAVPAAAGWRITAPIAARADAAAVEALVSQLVGLPRERTVEGADRKAMGLAPPRAKVTLRTAKGERVLEGWAPTCLGLDESGARGRRRNRPGDCPARAFFLELTKAPGDGRARDLFPAGATRSR